MNNIKPLILAISAASLSTIASADIEEVFILGNADDQRVLTGSGNIIDSDGQLVVMRFKHQVQSLEHRTRNIPVEVVGFEIERVAVS